MDWILIAQIPVLLVTLWIFTAYMSQSFPTLVGKRILLLIAHPDDEAMFFAPTLRWLTRKDLGNKVIILCLSSGNADGLGHIRKGELKKSALKLGIASEEHVVVIEDEKFPDSMTATWDPKLIGSILARYFTPNISSIPSTSKPTAGVDVLITFDSAGVSGHPNHISLFHGAVAFVKNIMQRHRGWVCPVQIYTLNSVHFVRKYSGFLDSITTFMATVWRPRERGSTPTPLVLVSNPADLFRAQMAMVSAHKSQMRWFRWGWIAVSRYMVVNDLSKQKIA